MRKLWSTNAVAKPDRLSYWIEAVCDTFVQLDCDTPDRRGPFRGEIAFNQLSTLELSRVTADSQWVRRTPAKIAQATEDYFLVSIQTKGRGQVIQGGRTAELNPGDFALYDSTRPYDLVFRESFQQYVLQMPGSVLRSRLRSPETLTAQKVHGAYGAGRLMISALKSLAAEIDTLEAGSIPAVAESVENILVAGLCSLPGAVAPTVSNLTAYHRDRIKAYVAERLHDPGLSVGEIASNLRISPSTAHRAFAGEASSLDAWIWSQRLERARHNLGDPALLNRSISEIAFGWGFNSAAHFSRAFRARFGASPRALRSECSGTKGGEAPD